MEYLFYLQLLQVVNPDAYVNMYNEYKMKLSEKPTNKWSNYEIRLPLGLATDIAQRLPSYG